MARIEEETRVIAVDLEFLFRLLLLGVGGCGREGGQRRAARQRLHVFYCVISTQ